MWKATLKGLLAHKLRLALTALAVVLGVAFMAGTFVLTDTIKHTFDSLILQTSAGKDVIVRAVDPFNSSGRGAEFGRNRPQIPASLLPTVRAVPGVQGAEGSVNGFVTLLTKSGAPIKKHGPPTLGFNWFSDRALSSLTLRSGRGPTASDEMTLDSGTAKSQHMAVGDRLTVIGNAAPRQFRVVGITGFGSADNLAGATILTFDTPTAQEMFGKPGQFAEIDVHATPGTNVDQLLGTVGSHLPQGVEAVSGASVAQQTAKGVESFINLFNTFLLVFAVIALLVGAFLIFNTFSILVGQRTRELALLRAVGASRGQVTRSVLTEAVIVGLLGSLVGLGIGVPLAAGLYAALGALGLSLPSTALQLLPRTIIVSVGTGTIITIVSAILPARRASRIAPVAAMREDAMEVETSLRRRAVIGGAVTVAGLAALFGGLAAKSGLLIIGLGAAGTFFGVAILAPFVSGPLARLIGAPLPAAQGVSGRLGRENAARNPRRTAATASALMIGLGVVAAIATVGSSAAASFSGAFDKGVTANFVAVPAGGGGGGGGEGFGTGAEAALASTPGVLASSPIRTARWHDGHATRDLTGIDPVAGPQVVSVPIISGSTASLARDELLIDDKTASSRHLKVGDTITMGFDATGFKTVVIGGIYKANALQFPLGSYTASTKFVGDNVNQVTDLAIAVKTASGSAAQLDALRQAVRAFPNIGIKTAAQFKADQKRQVSSILTIVYVLLALSIIIALIGVVNTLALSVMERTHEIGLLRAVGMQRRQVKRMIRGEAVVVSLIGAVLGLVLGIGLGAAIVRGLASTGFDTLAIPWATIITVLILTALFGISAAVFPARRAAKLDVLNAIAVA